MEWDTWSKSDKKVHAFAVRILEECEKEGMTMYEVEKLANDFATISQERIQNQKSRTSFFFDKAAEDCLVST